MIAAPPSNLPLDHSSADRVTCRPTPICTTTPICHYIISYISSQAEQDHTPPCSASMRQGVLFWILLLVLMSAALAQCRGCGKSFNNSNGLSNHHRKCTARLERINERARKKRAVGPAGLAQSSEHLRSANETADEHFEPSQPDVRFQLLHVRSYTDAAYISS